MTNYNKYKLILADIIIQNYKTDGENLYKNYDLAFEEDTSDIKDISFDWLLPKWNDKKWKSEILLNLATTIAIDNREDAIDLGLCACENITCADCAFGDIYSWGCRRSIEYWLEDEDNEVIE